MHEHSHKAGAHAIEIRSSVWSGLETVSYDGGEVSRKRSFLAITRHAFTANEDGQPVSYVVKNGGLIGSVIWRNGAMVSEYHSGGWRMLTSLAILTITGWIGRAALRLAWPSAPDVSAWITVAVLAGMLPLSWLLKRSLCSARTGEAAGEAHSAGR